MMLTSTDPSWKGVITLKKTIDQFNADIYNELFSYFGTYDKRLIRIMKSLVDLDPNVNVIWDLACGVGLSTLALRSNFSQSKILGIDIDSSLIDLARKTLPDPDVEFKCAEISDVLAETPKGTVDLVFVKSAYHYFEHQITLAHLQPILSEKGVIVIAERTSRSAQTYPLPEMASSYWVNIFAEPRPTRRLKATEELGMPLLVSCYGQHVTIPANVYLDAVRKNQLVGLWMLKPEIVENWVDKTGSQNAESFEIFEEFWLYCYKNSR